MEHCAYPQLWRESLSQSLALPSAGDAVSSSPESQLLASVLRHLATGALILVACLTERVPTFSSAATPDSQKVAASEWSPPCVDSRPDLAAINAAGCLWALEEIWQEVQASPSAISNNSTSTLPLVNGYRGNEHPPQSVAGAVTASKVPMRWVLCANLEASPTSPAYQILRDGYPSDESITRLQVVRNVLFKDATVRLTKLRVAEVFPRSILIGFFLLF